MSRHTIRLVGAVAAAAMAGLYYLIGLGVLTVVEPGTSVGDTPDMLVFGGGAGTMFLVGAILLATTDRRVLWIAGAILQVLVFAMYLSVSPTRTPTFEVWGITLRMIQVPLFTVLAYLALKAPERSVVRR